ncbi:hypothetical protein RhiirC2_850828 [Rhizophagus irregularis]|uniref:Uncharacterized protein n=1 Tax=Rhizophagus irregularis TaxID=588596 RepID=A0A2N1N612_9GLOM|nr:hypothetical protein RhiirC2_850828 [Rhizophagus irregularis]
MGYLDTINLNPYAITGPPESWKRAMGILRSCMASEAGEWFDREITGKNWKLSGITSRGGANLATFVALVIPEGAGGPNAGTYVNGSKAQAYATDPVNALATIRATFIPTHDLIGGDEAWGRAGACPTDRAASATADAGVAANNNHPIVFPGIKPNQALYWLRTQFPTVIDKKKLIRFNSLYQENEPVDAFYRTVKRAGKLLKLTDDLIIEQFFRGLLADNIFEAKRFHNLNPDDLVKHLRNLEQRNAEMRLGKSTPAKAVTKNDLLSLLRSADFRKLLREILQEEMMSARKVTEISDDLAEEEQEEDIRKDDPMDIDIARLENTKDLLALDGEVNGIAIQCLADTCANTSFIQRKAAEELGLNIDKSITHNISGAPETGRTFGMVKGVSIKLTPECIITEDLAVLSNYKYREIGLSQTCLKRYNYDVHESREHVALTCDEKNVFILIVPDVNRGDKK